jgi:hypothetical protein
MNLAPIPCAAALLVAYGAAACASGGSTYTPAESAAPPPEPAAMSIEEIAARTGELAEPGPEHRALAQQAGEWVLDYRIRFPPSTEWTETTGTASARPILGGRYLLEEHRYELMGQPAEGWLILGYDAMARQYVSLWMDTGSTWWSEARGTQDAHGVMTLRGETKDAAGARAYRMRVTHRPDGTSLHEMYDTVGGSEVLVMSYTRRRK